MFGFGCLCSALNTLQILPGQSKRHFGTGSSQSPLPTSLSPFPYTSPITMFPVSQHDLQVIQIHSAPTTSPGRDKTRDKAEDDGEDHDLALRSSGPHVCFINTSLEPANDSWASSASLFANPVLLAAQIRNTHDIRRGCDKSLAIDTGVGGSSEINGELNLYNNINRF